MPILNLAGLAMDENPDKRICKKCGKEMPLSDFGVVKGRGGKTYHRWDCKACQRTYGQRWRHENKDHLRESKRRYHVAHREAILARVQAWQTENREHKLEYQRLWYLANQEERLAKQKEWHEKNQDKVRAYREANRERIAQYMQAWRERNSDVIWRYQQDWKEANAQHIRDYAKQYRQINPEVKRISEANRRAQARGSTGHFTIRDVGALYAMQLGKCVYCDTDLSEAFQVDHIVPLSRGGSNEPENLQLLCARCNLMKHAKTHDEFLTWLSKKRG